MNGKSHLHLVETAEDGPSAPMADRHATARRLAAHRRARRHEARLERALIAFVVLVTLAIGAHAWVSAWK